ncbi:MAG: helix-turn-helix domain-containing protein [Bacteroidota bacterium]
MERKRMLAALCKTRGRVSGPNGAARLLGLKPSTMEYRIKKLDLLKEHKVIKVRGTLDLKKSGWWFLKGT